FPLYGPPLPGFAGKQDALAFILDLDGSPCIGFGWPLHGDRIHIDQPAYFHWSTPYKPLDEAHAWLSLVGSIRARESSPDGQNRWRWELHGSNRLRRGVCHFEGELWRQVDLIESRRDVANDILWSRFKGEVRQEETKGPKSATARFRGELGRELSGELTGH